LWETAGGKGGKGVLGCPEKKGVLKCRGVQSARGAGVFSPPGKESANIAVRERKPRLGRPILRKKKEGEKLLDEIGILRALERHEYLKTKEAEETKKINRKKNFSEDQVP